MSKDYMYIINKLVWFIPFRKIRDSVRNFLIMLVKYYNRILENQNEILENQNEILENQNEILENQSEILENQNNKVITRLDLNSKMIGAIANISEPQMVMPRYSFEDKEVFDRNIEEFKNNLDTDSLEYVDIFLNQIRFLRRYDISLNYIIPASIKFYTEEQKFIYANKDNIIKELKEKYYLNYNIPISIHVHYYDSGLIFLPNNVFKRFKNTICIDGGAWIGDSSIMFERYGFSSIYAFEPVMSTFNILRENVSKYNLENKVIPYRYGLGDSDKDLKIIFGTDADNGAYISDDNNFGNNEKIHMITIDKFEKDLQIEISLIKLDIEGYEKQALDGAIETIKKYKPVLLISCYHDWNSPYQMFEIKKFIENLGLGYKILFRQLDVTNRVEYNIICYTD